MALSKKQLLFGEAQHTLAVRLPRVPGRLQYRVEANLICHDFPGHCQYPSWYLLNREVGVTFHILGQEF